MKTFLRLFVVLGFILAIPNLSSFCQVSINTDGSAADSSAMLDVKSATKGFLPPGMTTAQMKAIINPAEGLTVYNTSCHSMIYYNGTEWKRADGLNYIGGSYGGGIIFYIDSTGQHGLICAASDQALYVPWGCYGNLVGTSTAIGTGQANTTAIINGCGVAGDAAWIANDLELNGYSDWFLPSKDELTEMYLQKSAIGGYFSAYSMHWSSSEFYTSTEYAWMQYFDCFNCNPIENTKYGAGAVRAIRAF